MKEILVVQLRKKKFKNILNSAQNENMQNLGYILKLKLIGLLMGWIQVVKKSDASKTARLLAQKLHKVPFTKIY